MLKALLIIAVFTIFLIMATSVYVLEYLEENGLNEPEGVEDEK